MPIQYRLYLTEKDKELLSIAKQKGEPHIMHLEPIDKTKGYSEINIEVHDDERPVDATGEIQDQSAEEQKPVPAPNATVDTDQAMGSTEQKPVPQGEDIPNAEQYAGFTGESRVSSLDAFFKVNEAAESKSQQRLMGQAYAYKQGKLKKADMDPKYADQIVGLAQQVSDDELKKFAETKHKGLPENK